MAQRILALEFADDRVEAALGERAWSSFALIGTYQSERAEDESVAYPIWAASRMFALAPAGVYVAQWLQSFREFPPRMKPGSFSLDRVMESVTAPHGGNN